MKIHLMFGGQKVGFTVTAEEWSDFICVVQILVKHAEVSQ